MKKLINGIVNFRKNVAPGYAETFARLALGQSPDTLFIGCSDSRVAPNLFASTDPGDLFVCRNVANLVPPCKPDHVISGEESVAAIIEFAVLVLKVSDIIVCGHSECGGMQATLRGREQVASPNLREWLRNAEPSLFRFHKGERFSQGQTDVNQLGRINVVQQIEHVKTYPCVQQRLQAGTLAVHGWWFDIARAEVSAWEAERGEFIVIDEEEAARIVQRIEAHEAAKSASRSSI